MACALACTASRCHFLSANSLFRCYGIRGSKPTLRIGGCETACAKSAERHSRRQVEALPRSECDTERMGRRMSHIGTQRTAISVRQECAFWGQSGHAQRPKFSGTIPKITHETQRDDWKRWDALSLCRCEVS